MSKILNPTFTQISTGGLLPHYFAFGFNAGNALVCQALPVNRRTTVYGLTFDSIHSQNLFSLELYTGGDHLTGTRLFEMGKFYVDGNQEPHNFIFPLPMLFKNGVYIWLDMGNELQMATSYTGHPGGFLLHYE
tara:strand:+ start:6514 stop:6912 length:399 start_codon:yes stop_codon:yes gene_type:complete